jgi:hypothetical protein
MLSAQTPWAANTARGSWSSRRVERYSAVQLVGVTFVPVQAFIAARAQ